MIIGQKWHFPFNSRITFVITQHTHSRSRQGNWHYGCIALRGDEPTMDDFKSGIHLACVDTYVIACDMLDDTMAMLREARVDDLTMIRLLRDD